MCRVLFTLDEYLGQEAAGAQTSWRLKKSVALQHGTADTEHAGPIRLAAARYNNLASPPLAVRHCGMDAPTGDPAAWLVASPAPVSGAAAFSESGVVKGRADVLAARLCSVCACRQLRSGNLGCAFAGLDDCSRPSGGTAIHLLGKAPGTVRDLSKIGLNIHAVATAGACSPVWYKAWRRPLQPTQCPAHLCSCR